MAKVLTFPVKKQLSEETVKRLHEVAAIYVNLLNEVLMDACGDITDANEYEEMTELMFNAFLEGVIEAIANTEES